DQARAWCWQRVKVESWSLMIERRCRITLRRSTHIDLSSAKSISKRTGGTEDSMAVLEPESILVRQDESSLSQVRGKRVIIVVKLQNAILPVKQILIATQEFFPALLA